MWASSFFRRSFGLQNPIDATVFAVVLLVAETIGAIFDNLAATATSTFVGDYLLYHACYSTITYLSTITENYNDSLISRELYQGLYFQPFPGYVGTTSKTENDMFAACG